jgi:Homeodomain-like domain-containing protein
MLDLSTIVSKHHATTIPLTAWRLTLGESSTSGDNMTGAEHRLAALRLRKEGFTYQAIGDRIGISRQRAHQLVTDELTKLRTETPEAAEQVRQLELERLDAMLRILAPQVKRGDIPAMQMVLRIMERRAKLLGLDAPQAFTVLLTREITHLADELGLDVGAVLAEAEAILAGDA